METMIAKFRIVTPMFLGGAKLDAGAELREASIKGALRFWWRALAWAQIGAGSAPLSDRLQLLHKKEADLFGSTADGQSSIHLRLNRHKISCKQTARGVVHPSVEPTPTSKHFRAGARYLGYGVMEFVSSENSGAEAGRLIRPAINHDCKFELRLHSRTGFSPEVISALKLLGMLGGLGSKVRKGYGSLTLLSLNNGVKDLWSAPHDVATYEQELRALLRPTLGLSELPPFSAFSDHSRVCLHNSGTEAIAVLDDYGKQMQRYRSWGKHKMVNGEKHEKNFPDDHAWFKNDNSFLIPADFHPRRAIFGLPHNYGKYVSVNAVTSGRRASPLWFHVHDLGENATPRRYIGVATILCAQFLPPGEQINANNKPVPANPDYDVIHGFLDGYVGPADTKTTDRYFPSAQQVFP